MKNVLLSTLIVMGGLFTLASGASAQTGTVVMHITQDFEAGGKTLPAGTYKVFEGSSLASQMLILRGDEGSVFLIPTLRDSSFPGEAGAKLTRVGDVYYLSEIVSPLGTYTFTAPHELSSIAKAKSPESTAAGGTGR